MDLLTLSDADRAELHRRGFTDDEIATASFRSIQTFTQLEGATAALPGFNASGRYVCQSGLLSFVRTIDGEIVGFQTRSANGYRWASVEGNYRLPNGEPPLVFFSGSTETIYLVEGTSFKPAHVNAKTGAMVVGASGGNWQGSPQQLQELIRRYPDAQYVLLPDAVSVINPHIVPKYRQTAELFEANGSELHFQWWGQLEKDVEGDADEDPSWADGTSLLLASHQNPCHSCRRQVEVQRLIRPSEKCSLVSSSRS
ncbi:hypothetical protein [Synechococcus sp. NB0720_010]|uniref:hypothetical protein n=1 Tax=Synechococcus sp. NB0720_010 TaxID=2907159 RepID=UPI001FFACE70|nr:hypothetical protein [Synechococcus sp. NB0720_010]UPH89279.1 hypothetical protein LY254_08215 [Synechococcus sp. NB0720_010]